MIPMTTPDSPYSVSKVLGDLWYIWCDIYDAGGNKKDQMFTGMSFCLETQARDLCFMFNWAHKMRMLKEKGGKDGWTV